MESVKEVLDYAKEIVKRKEEEKEKERKREEEIETQKLREKIKVNYEVTKALFEKAEKFLKDKENLESLKFLSQYKGWGGIRLVKQKQGRISLCILYTGVGIFVPGPYRGYRKATFEEVATLFSKEELKIALSKDWKSLLKERILEFAQSYEPL